MYTINEPCFFIEFEAILNHKKNGEGEKSNFVCTPNCNNVIDKSKKPNRN